MRGPSAARDYPPPPRRHPTHPAPSSHPPPRHPTPLARHPRTLDPGTQAEPSNRRMPVVNRTPAHSVGPLAGLRGDSAAGNSLLWSELRREGHESCARMAGGSRAGLSALQTDRSQRSISTNKVAWSERLSSIGDQSISQFRICKLGGTNAWSLSQRAPLLWRCE